MVGKRYSFDVAETRAEVMRGADFEDEVKTDSDRGLVLAGVARIERALARLVARRLGEKEPDDDDRVQRRFVDAITIAFATGIIDECTRDVLDKLRILRNVAAHDPKRFDLGQLPLAKALVAAMTPGLVEIRGSSRDVYDDGLRGDVQRGLRLAWIELEDALIRVRVVGEATDALVRLSRPEPGHWG